MCVAEYFHISFDEAVILRHEKLPGFSTTLEWLRHEGLTDTEKYFAAVHPKNETEELPFDPDLRPLLQTIPLPKIILTNAPREHAERVLDKLNVADLFDSICDIRDCKLNGKPYPEAFHTALKMCGGTIDDSVFLDDQTKYTDGFAALGGTAVLVGNKPGWSLEKTASAVTAEVPPHPGRTLKISSIYILPSLLKQLSNL